MSIIRVNEVYLNDAGNASVQIANSWNVALVAGSTVRLEARTDGSVVVPGALTANSMNVSGAMTVAGTAVVAVAPTTAGNVMFTTNGTSWSSTAKIVSGTAVASTSGTSIDFTGIPSWAKRVTVMFAGVSVSGTSSIMIQIGDSGGIETTGYLGSSTVHAAGSGYATYTTGFGVFTNQAFTVISGSVTLSLLGSNLWVASGVTGYESSAACALTGGQKTLSAILDRVRITTVGGTDTFDAGTINIMYE